MTAIITEDLVESLCSEAKTLTEFERRQFQAEMATKYCGGGAARRSEAIPEWCHGSVGTGLNEMRTGIRGVECFFATLAKEQGSKSSAYQGRDPKDRGTASSGRSLISGDAGDNSRYGESVRDQLLKNKKLRDTVPCRQAIGTILNRLGYSLQRVQKRRPENRFLSFMGPFIWCVLFVKNGEVLSILVGLCSELQRTRRAAWHVTNRRDVLADGKIQVLTCINQCVRRDYLCGQDPLTGTD